jgi:hypothetical protein
VAFVSPLTLQVKEYSVERQRREQLIKQRKDLYTSLFKSGDKPPTCVGGELGAWVPTEWLLNWVRGQEEEVT